MITIRSERAEDLETVRSVNQQAFASAIEADLVDALRAAGVAVLSLVALWEKTIAGHILFSPITLEGSPRSCRALGLAPMAVLPEYQRKGIGSQLVRIGLDHAREAGYEAVFVLGHRDYYPRFGFVRASRFGCACEFPAPDDSFFAMELMPAALEGCSGVVRYHRAFQSL